MLESGAGGALLARWRQRADDALQAALPAPTPGDPVRLQGAMRHAALLGGKRMRPLLTYATGHALGVPAPSLDSVAAAVELIHAYSLVHDDLPAMDDDALRRGQPTVHVAFDEATAILAGDALQSLAFAQLAAAPLEPAIRIAMVAELAHAAGAAGMCGGQALDIDATGVGGGLAADALERLHAMKTGALLRAAVRLGALAARADAATASHLEAYASALGLAFQVRDDLLDIEGSSDALGKTAGKDAAQHKATFPAVIGVEASRARLADLAGAMHAALAALAASGAANAATLEPLAALGRYTIERGH